MEFWGVLKVRGHSGCTLNINEDLLLADISQDMSDLRQLCTSADIFGIMSAEGRGHYMMPGASPLRGNRLLMRNYTTRYACGIICIKSAWAKYNGTGAVMRTIAEYLG